MFSQYTFVKKENGRYYYRSHGCGLEWDLSFTVDRLLQYTNHGLPSPPVTPREGTSQKDKQ